MKRAFVFVLGVVLASFCMTGVLAPVTFAEGETETEDVKTEEVAGVNLEVDKFLNFGQLSERGVSYTSSFKIRNNGTADAQVEFSFASSEYPYLKSDWKKGADWLAIVGGQVKQTIPAGGEKDIRVRATIPADAVAGSQYAAIEVAAANGAKYRVDVRMDVAGDDLRYAGELDNVSIESINFSKNIIARATVKNVGNGGFAAKQVIRYRAGLSEAGDWITLVEDEKEVPNGTEVSLSTNGAEEIGYGIFKVEQKITYVGLDGKLVEATRSQIVINCPWWVLAAVGGVIVVIIILVIVLKRIKANKKEAIEE